MALTIEESHDSQSLSADRGERRYVIRGTANSVIARNLARTVAPPVLGELVIQDVAIDVTNAFAPDDEGYMVARVSYGRLRGPAAVAGLWAISWATAGGTHHITQSRASRGYGPDANVEANQNAIGVDDEAREVRGVDIIIPQLNFTIRSRLDPVRITPEYVNLVMSLTRCVNSQTFLGFPPGTILFLGVENASYADGDPHYELQYAFAASPNETDLQVGEITGITKYGWEVLDVRYKTIQDSKNLFKQPRAAYVHQVYPPGDLNALILS